MISASSLAHVDVKSEDAPPFEGKPTWHGYYRLRGRAWKRVTNNARLPIAYASEDAARAGALFTASEDHQLNNGE